jgi:hypothetical protein
MLEIAPKSIPTQIATAPTTATAKLIGVVFDSNLASRIVDEIKTASRK